MESKAPRERKPPCWAALSHGFVKLSLAYENAEERAQEMVQKALQVGVPEFYPQHNMVPQHY